MKKPINLTGMQVKITRRYIYILLMLLMSQTTIAKSIIIGGLDGLSNNDTELEYPVLLALSGGGARGFSTIGILQAFEEKNIKIKGIAGTSMGGIIGGLYASGYTPYQLDSIASFIDFDLLFSNSPSRQSMFLTRRAENDHHLISIRFNKFKPVIPKAFTAGHRLTVLLNDLTTVPNYKCDFDFTRLKTPFKTISTDIVSGKGIILDSGSMADAMRATMAFPLAFTGLERGEQILMDGGMISPIPVDIARSLSDEDEFIIAINTSSKLIKKDDLNSAINIANQVSTIMTADQLQIGLSKADFVIEPPIDNFKSSDFEDKKVLIDIGYQTGLAAADKIIDSIKNLNYANRMVIDSIYLTMDDGQNWSDYTTDWIGETINEADLILYLKQLTRDNNWFRLESRTETNAGVPSDEKHFSLYLSAQKQFKTAELNFQVEGNKIATDMQIARMIPNSEYLGCDEIKSWQKNIISLYKENGFELINIKETIIDHKSNTITFHIDEAIIKQIDIVGNKHTKDWYVRSHFPLKKGMPYSTSEAAEGVSNIYGTDLFDRVSVDAIPSDEGVIVKIHVEEKNNPQLRVGWHWDDEYQSEEFVEFLDDNFAGIGLEYLFHLRYSDIRKEQRFTFKADRIWSTYITARFDIYHKKMNRQIYDINESPVAYRREHKTGISLKTGQQIARLGAVTAEMLFEEVAYDDLLLNSHEEYSLRSLKFESLVESFDKVPFPQKGNKHLFQLQFTGKIISGDIEYTKFYTSHEAYIPLGSDVNYHPYLALGASRSGLPPTEQFYIGGMRSFSGFRTYQLSGDKMFLMSHELRFRLPFNSYFTMRYDMGEVYGRTDQIKLRNLRSSIGAIFSLDLPIGPFEFGYGLADSDLDKFYLNIGFLF